MRRRAWIGLALAAALAGCGKDAGPPTLSGSRGMIVGMVTDVGGVQDQSFNMMAKNGLERADKELDFGVSLVESRQPAEFARNLERMAQRGCRVVFAVGFALEPAVAQVAPRYPRTHFVIIDAPGPRLPNVTGVTFREEEGSFLAGALAGGMTKRNRVGFVGGMEIPIIRRFEAGFRAGVKTTNPRAIVLAKYTNEWESVQKGKELALSLYDQGADIVMHASGRCGLGVIEAAKERGPGFWAIGVDADQDYLGTADPANPRPPSRVLTSMMKRVDNAVFSICREAHAGRVTPGPREFGVKEEGVGLTPLTYTRSEVPPALLKRVEQLRAEIAAGRLRPPRTVEEVSAWQPPAGARETSGPRGASAAHSSGRFSSGPGNPGAPLASK